MTKTKRFVIVNIIPTGIKCSIGGYIGDASLVTNKLASVCDWLITNPNAVNAGAFNFKEKNVLYVEGCAIDKFFQNKIGFSFPVKNSIGVIIENIEDKIALGYILKAIEAFKTVLGIKIKKIKFIPVLPKSIRFQYGQFCAEIKNVDILLKVAKSLRDKGINAIAITTHLKVPLKYIQRYQRGSMPNPYGLLEALISHAVTDSLKIPCAHAPLLTKKEMDFFLFNSFNSDGRSAFENISSAYIGSVLLGLRDAPRLVMPELADIKLKDVKALIAPSNCLRSIPVAAALKRKIPVLEIKENKNIFKSFPRQFIKSGTILSVNTYNDAIKVINRLK